MQSPCNNHANTMQSYAIIMHHHANTMQSPCNHYANTMQSLCKYHANTMQSPCNHYANTMQSSCKHHAIIKQTPCNHHAITMHPVHNTDVFLMRKMTWIEVKLPQEFSSWLKIDGGKYFQPLWRCRKHSKLIIHFHKFTLDLQIRLLIMCCRCMN